MNNELKPCPFCGGNNTKLYSENDTNLHGFIHLCDGHKDYMVKIESRLFTTEKEAVNAWNTRVTPSNNPLTLEQLKERVGKPVWCSRNKLYGVVGMKNDRYVVGFYYGWEWLEDLISGDIYDHELKGV